MTDWIGAERGRFQRPIKQQITFRIDADMLAWFKARLQGFQWGHAEPGRAAADDHDQAKETALSIIPLVGMTAPAPQAAPDQDGLCKQPAQTLSSGTQ